MGAAIGAMLSAVGAAISDALVSAGLAGVVTVTTYDVGAPIAFSVAGATISDLTVASTVAIGITPTVTGYAAGAALAAAITGGVIAGALTSQGDHLGSGTTLTNIIGVGTPGKAFEHILKCPSLLQQLQGYVNNGYKSCNMWDFRSISERFSSRSKGNGRKVHVKKEVLEPLLEQSTTSSQYGSTKGGKMDGKGKRLRTSTTTWFWEVVAYKLVIQYKDWAYMESPFQFHFALSNDGIIFIEIIAVPDKPTVQKINRCRRYWNFQPPLQGDFCFPDYFSDSQYAISERTLGPRSGIRPQVATSNSYVACLDQEGRGIMCMYDKIFTGMMHNYITNNADKSDYIDWFLELICYPVKVERMDYIEWVIGRQSCGTNVKCLKQTTNDFPCIGDCHYTKEAFEDNPNQDTLVLIAHDRDGKPIKKKLKDLLKPIKDDPKPCFNVCMDKPQSKAEEKETTDRRDDNSSAKDQTQEEGELPGVNGSTGDAKTKGSGSEQDTDFPMSSQPNNEEFMEKSPHNNENPNVTPDPVARLGIGPNDELYAV
ncbi:UNVERIFIED_CONTAM: hypothetical protein NCL1_59268 [Trichonephila clavipes]